MKRDRPLLPRLIGRVLIFGGKVTVLVFKLFLLAFMGFRKLRVERVMANNAFLFANGLVVVQWRVKYALWITVQGKWQGSRGNRVMVLKSGGIPSIITIRMRGYFSSYTRSLEVLPVVEVTIGEAMLSCPGLPMAPDVFHPEFSSLVCRWEPISKVEWGPRVAPLEITLPEFQTEKQYEKRLLQ